MMSFLPQQYFEKPTKMLKSRHSRVKAATVAVISIILLMTLSGLRKSETDVRRYLCTSRTFYASDSQGDNFMTNVIDGLITASKPSSSRALSVEEECETIYPSSVSTARWTEYYDTEDQTGLYYEEIAPVDILRLEGFNPDVIGGEVDPTILAPDSEMGAVQRSVDTSVLSLFEPRVYEPVAETNRPKDTTAYAVVIECCPEKYEALLSGTTDPGADIFEASAMMKQSVCNATETAAEERRKRRREQELVSLENIEDLNVYALGIDPNSYTM